MDRADAVSHGVTETEVLTTLLGPDGMTEDREADLIKSIKLLERQIIDIPLQLRILYHGLYATYHPENSDVWLRVGIAAGWPAKQAKNKAWRRAHPRGLETEPPNLPEEGEDPDSMAELDQI